MVSAYPPIFLVETPQHLHHRGPSGGALRILKRPHFHPFEQVQVTDRQDRHLEVRSSFGEQCECLPVLTGRGEELHTRVRRKGILRRRRRTLFKDISQVWHFPNIFTLDVVLVVHSRFDFLSQPLQYLRVPR